MPDGAEPCPACGRPLRLVWIHGHGQCAACGANVVPCCQGAGEEAPEVGDMDTPSAEVVVDVLRSCGASVTRSSLLHLLVTRTGCPRAGAVRALAHAARTRRVVVEDGVCSLP